MILRECLVAKVNSLGKVLELRRQIMVRAERLVQAETPQYVEERTIDFYLAGAALMDARIELLRYDETSRTKEEKE
jgi:hypothetical protein